MVYISQIIMSLLALDERRMLFLELTKGAGMCVVKKSYHRTFGVVWELTAIIQDSLRMELVLLGLVVIFLTCTKYKWWSCSLLAVVSCVRVCRESVEAAWNQYVEICSIVS